MICTALVNLTNIMSPSGIFRSHCCFTTPGSLVLTELGILAKFNKYLYPNLQRRVFCVKRTHCTRLRTGTRHDDIYLALPLPWIRSALPWSTCMKNPFISHACMFLTLISRERVFVTRRTTRVICEASKNHVLPFFHTPYCMLTRGAYEKKKSHHFHAIMCFSECDVNDTWSV